MNAQQKTAMAAAAAMLYSLCITSPKSPNAVLVMLYAHLSTAMTTACSNAIQLVHYVTQEPECCSSNAVRTAKHSNGHRMKQCCTACALHHPRARMLCQ